MTEWEPATETEAAMRDALRAGDQELYFRILARTDLLLPVSAEALAGRAPMGWGTWTTGGRTHVLAFTSEAALHACLAENAGSTRLARYAELASGWPNPEWWLAVNPGLPIEGYLPAWFVSQLSRGDVRLPGRSIGARARLEQVERAARARATAAVPRRPAPDGPVHPQPEPAGPHDSSGRPEPSAQPGPFGPPQPQPGPFGHPESQPGPFGRPEPSGQPDSFREPERPVRPDPFSEPAASFARAERHREAAGPQTTERFPATASQGGPPATVPVIAPTSDRGDRVVDFGSQISADTSVGWMTPAGSGQPDLSSATNGGPPAGPEPSDATNPAAEPGSRPSGPPPAWYGPAGQPVDLPTAPLDETSGNGSLGAARPSEQDAPVTPPARVPAPEPWTPNSPPATPSLFTPVSRRPVGESWSGDRSDGSATVHDPAADRRTEATPPEPARTEPVRPEPVRTETAVTESLFTPRRPTEPFDGAPVGHGTVATGPSRAEAFAAEPAAGTAFSADPVRTKPFPSQAIGTEPLPSPAIGTEPRSVQPVGSPPPAVEPGSGAPGSAARGGAAVGSAEPDTVRLLPSDFVPANDVERSLLDAAGDGSTDTFLSTLLLAKVLLPVAPGSAVDARPGDDGFQWRTETLDGETYVVVFTSPERLGDHLPGRVETVTVKFAQLIRRWPDAAWSFAVNPGTPVGAKLPGGQIVALANWAAEVGLGDDTDPAEQPPPAPAEEEAPRSTYAPAREDPGRPTMMQKTVAPSQLSYYLDRGYDRVSGFVHRASEVAHLRSPAKLYAALGLGYPGSPFARDADEIYVLRWPAYRPSLYRIPYGGQSEAAMRAMEGWVIERPPFRGNGFAPGESSDVVAEFKVDSVRLPHGTELFRIGADGTERLVATLDCDVPVWRRAEED